MRILSARPCDLTVAVTMAPAMFGVADGDALAVAEHQDIVESRRSLPASTSSFSTRSVSPCHHAVLLTAGDDDCVHDRNSSVVIVDENPAPRSTGQKRNYGGKPVTGQTPWPVRHGQLSASLSLARRRRRGLTGRSPRQSTAGPPPACYNCPVPPFRNRFPSTHGHDPHSRRPHPQPQEHRSRPAARPADRDHRPVRLGQVARWPSTPSMPRASAATSSRCRPMPGSSCR